MEGLTFSAIAYESFGLSPTVLISTILMTVIIGGMRTTRHATLATLQLVSHLGVVGKVWHYSPHRVIWAGLKLTLPPCVRSKVKAVVKGAIRMVLGRSALKKTAIRHKHSLRHHSKKGRPHLNPTISLYRRMPLKAISRLWGRLNEIHLPMFLRRPVLKLYIWWFSCKLEEASEEDLRHYPNLGEFFRRTLKDHCRPIDYDHDLTSPADGKILYYGRVKHGILEQVKGVTYSLRGFLGPQTWESAMHGQDINHQSDPDYQTDLSLKPGNELHHCIIYLAPGDYHRFHSPVAWTVDHRRHFPGELLSVNPGVARWVQGLFNFNERVVYTGNWEHGFFSMTPVGATNVGSIKIYCDEELSTNKRDKHPEHTYFDKKFSESIQIEKGEMFGEFNLGSTIVLIFEAPKGFDFKIKEGQKIKYGQPIGHIP